MVIKGVGTVDRVAVSQPQADVVRHYRQSSMKNREARLLNIACAAINRCRKNRRALRHRAGAEALNGTSEAGS